MKVVNRIIKAIAYVAVLAWVFFGLYLFALFITASVGGILVGALSLIKKSIPLVIQRRIGLAELLSAIPVTVILYFTSYLRARKQSKQIMETINK